MQISELVKKYYFLILSAFYKQVPNQKENDNFKNELFQNSPIKLIRIKAYPDYSEKYVKDSLDPFLDTI